MAKNVIKDGEQNAGQHTCFRVCHFVMAPRGIYLHTWQGDLLLALEQANWQLV